MTRESSPVGQLHEVLGRVTEMTCACGGVLQEVKTVVVPKYRPRHHRKKRIRKKWKARWERENISRTQISVLVGLMQPPTYRCEKCGKRDGFYSAVGRNLIKVEPLPEGAFPSTTARSGDDRQD